MHVTALDRAGHYYQSPHRRPGGHRVDAGNERVELVTGGRGWFDHDGRLVPVSAGSLLWHVAGDRCICRSDDSNPYRCLVLHFLVDDATGVRRLPRHSRWEELDRLHTFTREVLHCAVDEAFDAHALLHYAYGRLVFQARRWQRRSARGQLPPGLARAVGHIDQHFDRSVDTRDLAAIAGCSVPHLHEIFKHHLHTTPHRYLTERRMRAAREHLLGGDAPIAAVATCCGFADSAAFCRAFKRAAGTSPAAYRREFTEHMR